MRAIFATDLHGNRHAYEALFARAEREQIKAVILGGDLTPKWPVLTTLGDAVIPAIPRACKEDSCGRTFSDFLGTLEDEERSPRKMEARYVALGGYLEVVRDRVTFAELLGEQRALAQVLAARNAPGRAGISGEHWPHLERAVRRRFPEAETLSETFRSARVSLLTDADRLELARAEQTVWRAVELARDALPESLRGLVRAWPVLPTEKSHLPVRDLAGYAAMAANDGLAAWLERARSFDVAGRHQTKFLSAYLAARMRKYRQAVPGSQVFLILGNDDHKDCRETIAALHRRGACHDLAAAPATLGGVTVAGYPYVPSSHGRFYDAWEKDEYEILADLRDAEARCAGKRTAYVVHAPPHGTPHDQSFDQLHFGSEGVLAWLQDGPKHLVLSGHIHESPFVNGSVWKSDVEGTPVIQPGAWHDEQLCAVVLDLDDPAGADWIRPDRDHSA